MAKPRGRKPLPTQLHIIHGNPGKRPLNKNEPKPKPGRPTCPAHLSKEAKKEWKRIVPELEKLGLLTKIDRTELAMYCQAYGRWVEAEKIVYEKGTLYKTKSGNVITSPMLWVANKAMEQMHKFLTEFGMTPSSRTRIKIEPKEKEDPMETYLGKKKK
jgi:P27 family predicted phage terminase small subunit